MSEGDWRDLCEGDRPHQPRLVRAWDGGRPLDAFLVCARCGRCHTEEFFHPGAWFWQTVKGPWYGEVHWQPLPMTFRRAAWARLRAALGVYL